MLAGFVRLTTSVLMPGRRWVFAALGRLMTWLRRATCFLRAGKPACFFPRTVIGGDDRGVVIALERAWVLGREGCVCDSAGEMLGAVSPRAGYLGGWAHPLLQRLRPWQASGQLPEAVLLSGGHADNYYHWMFEVLPRALLLEQAGVEWRALPVLAPTDMAFQRESLAVLGIADVRALQAEGVISVGRLHCTLPPFAQRVPRAAVCNWLRSCLGAKTDGPRRRLLIQRRHGKRSIRNFDELAAALVPLGFEIVAAEKLTFAEQVARFAAADCVVAAHGAGLANLVFCQPGTRVIELLSADYLTRLYADIATDCALEYRAVVTRPVGRAWEVRQGSKQLLVDVAEVCSALK